MTQPIGPGNQRDFLSFSIRALTEYSEVASAAKEVFAGNKAPCAMQSVYLQRYDELRKKFKIIDAKSVSDYDFGARGTLREMKAALSSMYLPCSQK